MLPVMLEEPIKYFSLPRPKYNPNGIDKAPALQPTPPAAIEVSKVKRRVDAENIRQKRVGGRRFTVTDVASNDIKTALADLGIKKFFRSSSELHHSLEDEMKLRTLPNMKRKEVIPEEEDDGVKGYN